MRRKKLFQDESYDEGVEQRLQEREQESQSMAEEEAKKRKFEELTRALLKKQKVRMENFKEEERIKKLRERTTGRLEKVYGPLKIK